jgi:glycosyltransferase involved in cell wall biosynthesis
VAEQRSGRRLRAWQASFDADQGAADWLDWHDSLPLPVRRRHSSALPLVSVIIPIYSSTQHVLEALQSLLVQTYDGQLEVIVVNDGTRGVESLSHYKEVAAFVRLQPRWQYVVVPHGGESLARNAGSERASGEFLLFMDDDNLAQPTEVDEFVRAIQPTDVDVLTCMAETFSGAPPRDDNSSYWWMPLGPAVSVSVFHNVVGDSNFFIRSSVFRPSGGFAEGLVAEDRELLTRLMLGGARMQLLPHVLLWKRSSELSRLHIVEAVDNRLAVVDAFLGHEVPHDLGVALLSEQRVDEGGRAAATARSQLRLRLCRQARLETMALPFPQQPHAWRRP